MASRLLRLGEGIFCLVAISVFLGAYTGIAVKLSDGAPDPGAQNPVNTAAQAFVLLSLVPLGALRWRRLLAVASRGALVNLFVLLAWLSALWSIEPQITLRRALTLTTEVAFAYYAAATFPIEMTIRRVAFCAVLAAIASAAVAILIPHIGVMGGSLAGAWNGVFSHKNQLGWTMILGVLCYGWLWLHRRARLRDGAGLVICAALAVLARSKTAELAIAMMPVIGVALLVRRLPGLARLWTIYAGVLTLLLLGTVGTIYFTDVMAALGRDPSLTGRTPLWLFLLGLAQSHWLLGYGYGAFFLRDNPDLQWTLARIGWEAFEAHEGYIEVLLELGVAGLLLAVAIMLDTTRRALAAVQRGTPAWGSFAAIYAVTFISVDLVEALLLHPGNVNSMLLPLLYAGLRTEAGPLPDTMVLRPQPLEAAS